MSRYESKLGAGNAARLTVLMMEEFNKSGLSDHEFARHASKKLGVNVLDHHITTRRKTLGIPANMRITAGKSMRVKPEDFEGLKTDFEALQEQVQMLERLFNDMLRKLSHPNE